MIDGVFQDTERRMQRAREALAVSFQRIRTGRASPGVLDSVSVDYYGNETPLHQVAGIVVEDARTLLITPWEKSLVPAIEKAIMGADLGLNPSTSGEHIRILLPALTEESRQDYVRQARADAEQGRVAVRNIRRDANNQLKRLQKDGEIASDEEHRAQTRVQGLTDAVIAEIDKQLAGKEAELTSI